MFRRTGYRPDLLFFKKYSIMSSVVPYIGVFFVDIKIEFEGEKKISSLSVTFYSFDPFVIIKAVIEDMVRVCENMPGARGPLCIAGEEEISPGALWHQIRNETALPVRFAPIQISGSPDTILLNYIDNTEVILSVFVNSALNQR